MITSHAQPQVSGKLAYGAAYSCIDILSRDHVNEKPPLLGSGQMLTSVGMGNVGTECWSNFTGCTLPPGIGSSKTLRQRPRQTGGTIDLTVDAPKVVKLGPATFGGGLYVDEFCLITDKGRRLPGGRLCHFKNFSHALGTTSQ